jgi:hypothetical protein
MSSSSTTWTVDTNTDETAISSSSSTAITIGSTTWTYDTNTNASSASTTSWTNDSNTT